MPGIDLSFLPDQPRQEEEREGLRLPDGPSRLGEVYQEVVGMNPVDAARTIRLALQTGTNPAYAKENGVLLDDLSSMPVDAYWKWVEENRPVTTQYISDPIRMAAVKDILDELTRREGFFKYVGRAWRIGSLQTRIGELAYQQIASAMDTDVHPAFYEEEIARMEKELQELLMQGVPGGFGGWVYDTVQEFPQLGLMAKRGGFWAAAGGLIGGLLALGAGLLVPAPEEAVTIPAGVLAGIKLGAAAGGKVGVTEAMAILEAGSAYREYIRLRDKDGKPISPRLAAAAALAVGWANAGLEYMGLASIAKTIPGGAAFLKGLSEGVIKKAGQQIVKNLAAQGAKAFGAELLTNLSQEYAQETVTQVGGEAAKYIASRVSGQRFEFTPAKEIFARSGAVLKPTLHSSTLFGLPGFGMHIFQSVIRTNQAQTDAQIYKEAGQVAAASEHLNRFPEGFREHAGMALTGGPQTVYLDAEPLLRLMQDTAEKNGLVTDEAVRIAAYELGLDRDQLQAAADAGQPVAVPFALWMEKTAKTPAYAAMEQHIKFDPDGLTLAQAALEEERIKTLVEQEQARAREMIQENEERRAGWDMVYNDITQKLLAAGRPERISKRIWGSYVDRAARLWAARAVTEAARRGITVEEWYKGANRPAVAGPEASRIRMQAGGIAQEIKRRFFGGAGQKDRAFQFLFPELAPYIQEEAKLIRGEMSEAIKGERGFNIDRETGESINWGIPKLVSESIQRIQDETGASYAEIAQALDDIIAGREAANYALAKKIEIVIDQNLSQGVERSGSWGRADQEANQAYLEAKKGLGVQTLEQAAYHASVADFERFDVSFVGSGIQQTLFGWGIYFTSRREMAEHYRQLREERTGQKGLLYEAEIPDDAELLDWEKTLGEQPNKVQRALEKIIAAHRELEALGNPTGGEFYQALSELVGGDRAASLLLQEAGIPGAKHFTRLMGGANNYAIWDQAAMEIIGKEYYQDGTGPVQDQQTVPLPESVTVTTMEAAPFGEDLSLQKLQDVAGEYYREHLQGKTATNAHTGWEIGFSAKGRGHIQSYGATVIKNESVAVLDKLVENAVYLRTAPDLKERKSIKAWHYFYAPMETNGRGYVVRIAVRETRQGQKFYDHMALEIERPAGSISWAGAGEEPATQHQAVSGSTLSIDKLKELVNQARRIIPYFQGEEGPRGMVNIGAQASVISLLQQADASTFLHESAHVWLNDTFEFVKTGQADETYMADWKVLAEFLGVAEGQESLTTEQQEKFARSFEAYLLEGKAPSTGLRKVFQAFRRWLVRIYRSAAGLDVAISPEVRRVMDRMIATEEEIREAEIAAGHNEDVLAEKDTPPEIWARLQELKAEAREAAFVQLMRRQMEELSEKRQVWLRKEEERATEAIRAKMKEEPLYGAIDEIQRHIGGDPRILADIYREDRAALGEDAAGTIDGIAEGHGYSSGDELAQDIINNRSFEDELAYRVARHMEQHAGLLSPDNLKSAALEAIKNERREEFLALEETILRDLVEQAGAAVASGTEGRPSRTAALERARLAVAEARKKAREIMENKRHTEIGTPTAYFAAERDAAVAAAVAARKGDKAAALQYATRKLVNHALAMEAMRNRQEIEKIWRYIRRFQKRGRSLLDMPREFVRQADALLERFGLGPGPAIEPGDRVESLREFADRMKEEYHELPIAPEILNESFRKPWADLTLGELRNLYHAFLAIGTLGAKYNRFLNDFIKQEIRQAGAEIAASVAREVGAPKAEEKSIGSKTRLQKLLDIPDEIASWLVKPEFVARYLDGDKDGPVQKYFIGLFNKAWVDERAMESRVIQELRELVGQFYTPAEMAAMSRKSSEIYFDFLPGKNKNLTKEQRLLIALNWGNNGNRQRLMDGYGLNAAQVRAILDTLTERDWHLVQGIWDYLETFWPPVKKLAEDVTGVTPEKVERVPVVTKYGTFEGGYFPIAYDPEKSSAAARNDDQLNALYKEAPAASAMTRHGHDKARAQKVNRPVLLKWSVLTNHLVNVMHDLTHRRAIIDANRLLRNPDFRAAVEGAVGVKGFRALENAVKAIASDQGESMDFADRAFRFLRGKSTLYAMGLNLRVAMLQISGVFQSAWEIGAIPTMRGLARFAANPAATWKMVREKSLFMAERAQVMDRDIYDFSRRMFEGDNNLANFAYSIMGFMDQMWCVPAWAESYRMALAEGLTEEQAIERADGAIRRAAGSGAVKDLSAAQRGTEMKKAITMFYSYGNLLYNRYWLATKMAAAEIRHGEAGAATKRIAGLVAYGWILPGIFEFALREAMRQKGDDEEPEDFWKRFAAAMASGPLQTIPIVRDVGAHVVNRIFGQYSDFRITPLESTIDDLTRTVTRGINAAKGAGEWPDAVESAAKSGAYLAGIPQQVVNWVFNALDWFGENGEASWRDLFSRKAKD